MNLPRIAITMGDAAGVGPEIVMKALAHRGLYARCRPLVVGDAARLTEAGRIAGSDIALNVVAAPEAARFEAGLVVMRGFAVVGHLGAAVVSPSNDALGDLPIELRFGIAMLGSF